MGATFAVLDHMDILVLSEDPMAILTAGITHQAESTPRTEDTIDHTIAHLG